MIRVLIVDDHPLIGDGIKAMLSDETQITFVGTFKTGKEALAFLVTQQPEIILLDISLPDIDGLQLCEEIRKLYRNVKIIGLTSSNDASIISGLLQRGGNGYLLKNMEREELLEAIEAVLKGKVYVSKSANEKILEQIQNKRNLDGRPVLTRREREILQLLSDGLNGPQVAEKLFLSHYTVETHRKNLLKKFNVNSLQMLLRVARDHGILT